MKFQELLKTYINQREPHQRVIGRYNASELYEVLTDRLKPEDFLKPKRFDLTACRNIAEGELRELGLKMLLDASEIKYKYQVKKVEKFGNFEIVCVADFVFPDYILECKSPKEFSGIKEWNRPQLEAQFRIFNKKIFVIYIKERFEYQSYNYVPSENLWKDILEKVGKFDKQLKQE